MAYILVSQPFHFKFRNRSKEVTRGNGMPVQIMIDTMHFNMGQQEIPDDLAFEVDPATGKNRLHWYIAAHAQLIDRITRIVQPRKSRIIKPKPVEIEAVKATKTRTKKEAAPVPVTAYPVA
jgi:hypothetical protein